MTAVPDPEMKARAEGAAAQTADAVCDYAGVQKSGALWDAVYEAAVIVNTAMLQAQREDDQTRFVAKVAPAERGG